MIEVKNDNYVLHQGKLYRIGKTYEAAVHLCSSNPDDLNNGFICNSSESYIKKYGFVCIKEVPKSEITEAYEIRTYAVYKGVNSSIVGCSKENWIGLITTCLDGQDKEEFLKKVKKADFRFVERGQGGDDIYRKDVFLDDPDLKLIEKRTELDISKL